MIRISQKPFTIQRPILKTRLQLPETITITISAASNTDPIISIGGNQAQTLLEKNILQYDSISSGDSW